VLILLVDFPKNNEEIYVLIPYNHKGGGGGKFCTLKTLSGFTVFSLKIIRGDPLQVVLKE
jgi:hypothetical protein